MKYRIGTLIHDCPESKGRDNPYWDRGMWLLGQHKLDGEGKKGKTVRCPNCTKKLSDPLLSNIVFQGDINLFSKALQQMATYPALFIEKVDLRKKEFK